MPSTGGAVMVTVQLTAMTCPTCGVTYGIDEDIRSRKHREGGDWWCTNGHTIHYTQTENDRLKQELQAAQDATARAEAAARRERDAHIATKGQLTKAKKRLTAGVCPCCRRNFVALGEHMRKQHPDYVQETA